MHTFKEYYDSLVIEQRERLAESAGTSANYLYMLATDRRKAGASLIARLTGADRNITPAMLRPDLYNA